MVRTLRISRQAVSFKVSALLPRLYRYEYTRDLVVDMDSLRAHFLKTVIEKIDDNEVNFSVDDLQIFANVAYIMARHGGEIRSQDRWLESFKDDFTIYTVFPILLDMWIENEKTTSIPAKPSRQTTREATGATFMLRCAELGLSDEALSGMSMGMVADLMIEKANDLEEYPCKATQSDIQAFFG